MNGSNKLESLFLESLAESRFAENQYAECYFAQCHHAECHGANTFLHLVSSHFPPGAGYEPPNSGTLDDCSTNFAPAV
jgi:hypothetical protein